MYLALWFGKDHLVANSKRHGITSAIGLRESICEKMPKELIGKIDVFVLDLSQKLKQRNGCQ